MDPYLNGLGNALQVALGLGFVVFVHELGHFLVAKACGVKCEKFYVGFDFFDIKIGNVVILPRALFKYRWGETEYGLGIIPLGGYVKMLGQDDNPANQAQEAERTRVYRDGDGGSSEGESHIPSGDIPPEPTEPTYDLDPRSYPAKSVPQRMAIISAGVIMNLIFAVIFAAIAYGMGVVYTPTIVGGVQPGSPAFVAGIQPRDQIIRLEGGERSTTLRFDRDLKMAVGLATGQDVPLTIGRGPGAKPGEFAEEIEMVLVPEQNDPDLPIATIGIVPAPTLEVSPFRPVDPSMPSTVKAGFRAGDVIERVEGPFGSVTPKDGIEFDALLANHPGDEVRVFVHRTRDEAGEEVDPTGVELTLPPAPMRSLGLTMTMLPVAAVQKDSPADRAGLKPGDKLLTWNGEAIVDPRSLDDAALAFAQATPDQPATLEYERAGKRESVEITPRPRTQGRSLVFHLKQPLGVDTLGLAVPMQPTIVAIDPDGPAAKADLKVGDEIVGIDFVADDATRAKYPEYKLKAMELPEGSWAVVEATLQDLPPEFGLKLQRSRDDKVGETIVQPAAVEGVYLAHRGINLTPLQEIRTATGPVDAASLGLRETWEGAWMVLITLKKLATGEISPTLLGGPITIVTAASQQADVSVPRFLIFLTLLSANLAVVNFLPIPVLDGGHMMFLIFEGIRGKPLNEKWQIGLTILGFGMVMSLMVFVITMDITRLIPT